MVCLCPSGIPGSGPTRLLSTLYTDTAQRIRVAARGAANAAIFYYALDTGTPFTMLTASGGTALGSVSEPYFQGLVQNNQFYFTDRAGALRKFAYTPSSGNQVRAVALPVAPATAPGVIPRTYRMHEQWAVTGVDVFTDWTNDSPGDFVLQDY
ncbi:MAG TPA: hypothetical protein VFQ43_02995, partial [Nitrososphaera sp.]|nr:hypothetical protein [Nitrososphaera sp.]